MNRRLVLITALAVVAAVGTVSCGACWWRSHRARPDVIKVRWPPTVAVNAGAKLSQNLQAEEASGALVLPTDLPPGVRGRIGEALDLTYFEIILGDADFDDPLPLVVLLHGRGDRPRVPAGPFTSAPTPMRVVIPRGPIRVGAGFGWVPGSVTQGNYAALAQSLLVRTHHLAALIHTLYTTLPTLGRPIVVGFSQGAILAFSLALHRPDVVGRAFPIAGWVPPDLMPHVAAEPELRVPIRSMHGIEDAVIPIGPTRDVVAMLRALDWDAELVEFEGVGHVVSVEMNVTFEVWLEEALREQAPALTGRGLGMAGPEEKIYEPFEPLEPQTIEAIELLDAGEVAPGEESTDAGDDEPDPGTAPGTAPGSGIGDRPSGSDAEGPVEDRAHPR